MSFVRTSQKGGGGGGGGGGAPCSLFPNKISLVLWKYFFDFAVPCSIKYHKHRFVPVLPASFSFFPLIPILFDYPLLFLVVEILRHNEHTRINFHPQSSFGLWSKFYGVTLKLRRFPMNVWAIRAKIKLPTNTDTTVPFSIQLRRAYQYFSSQADPTRENWIWSYPYSMLQVSSKQKWRRL